jgi:hypothetical protein
MIASGEKLEEYRDLKPYWVNRLYDIETAKPVAFDSIIFHRGYTDTIFEVTYKGLSFGSSHDKWSENGISKWCFILKLGSVFNYDAFIRIKTELLLEDVQGDWIPTTPAVTKENVLDLAKKHYGLPVFLK